MVNAVLEYEGNIVKIMDFEHNKKRSDVGDPNNTAFVLRIQCAVGFAGLSRYVCDIGVFRRFISELDDLFKKKIVSAKLTDQSLGSYIKFKMSSKEVYIVSGMLISLDGEYILKFEFPTERSMIFVFTKQLREMISEYYGGSSN